MNPTYNHLESFTRKRLELVLYCLRYNYQPESDSKISINDLVQFRPEGYLGQVCRVETVEEMSSDCKDQVTKYQLKVLKKFRVLSELLWGDETNVFPLKQMQERLLAELAKPECDEAVVEFEALDILFSIEKGEFPTSDLPSQAAEKQPRKRSRSRSRSPSQEQINTCRKPETEKHRQSYDSSERCSQSQNPLKFSHFFKTKHSLNTPHLQDKLDALSVNWHQQIQQVLEQRFNQVGYPLTPQGQALVKLLYEQRSTVASYCELVHHKAEGANHALSTTVIDSFMQIVSSLVPNAPIKLVPRQLVDRLCTVVQNAIANGKAGGRVTTDLQKFRKTFGEPQSVFFTICRDNHHYVILMSFNRLVNKVEITVLDSMWSGDKKDHQWRGPRTGGMTQNQDTELKVNAKFKLNTNGFCSGLDAAFRCSLAYLAHILWKTPLKEQDVEYRFPFVPHQGANNDCGVHAIYHMSCLLLRSAEYTNALESGSTLRLKDDFSRRFRQLLRQSYRVVLDSFSQEDPATVFDELGRLAQNFAITADKPSNSELRSQQTLSGSKRDKVESANRLVHMRKFPDLSAYAKILNQDPPLSDPLYQDRLSFNK